MDVPDQNVSAVPEKALKVAVTHGSDVKINKIDVLVTHVKPEKRIQSKCKRKKMCVLFWIFGLSVRES